MVKSYACCGVEIAALSAAQSVQHLNDLAIARTAGQAVHLCNAYTLSLAAGDYGYAARLNGGLCLADGTPVAWLAKRWGYEDLHGPVRGPQLMLDVMRSGAARGARHYLYGSSPEVIQRLTARLPMLVPGIKIVGLESPPFRPLTRDEELGMILRIQKCTPDFVWVGLGTPKQDDFVSQFASEFGVVTVAVGAAFDFAAGAVKEAPAWLRGSGLEWLHRLYQDPRRLWKRYLLGNLIFLRKALLPAMFSSRRRRPSSPGV